MWPSQNIRTLKSIDKKEVKVPKKTISLKEQQKCLFKKNKSKSKKQTRNESYVKHEIENCCEKSAKKCEKAATANGLSCQFLKSLLANFLFCLTVK